MSYIVILMSFTAISPSIGHALANLFYSFSKMEMKFALISLALFPLKVSVPLVEYQRTENSSHSYNFEPPPGVIHLAFGNCNFSTRYFRLSKLPSHFRVPLSVIFNPSPYVVASSVVDDVNSSFIDDLLHIS